MRTGNKGFTLIEIVIVVVIIGILMLIGLGLNRDQLKSLKSRNAIENFQGDRDQAFVQVLNSSYLGWKKYDVMQIQLNTSQNQVQLSYFKNPQSNSDPEELQEKIQKADENSRSTDDLEPFGEKTLASETKWELAFLDWLQAETVNILYKPFSSSCQIAENKLKKLTFSLETGGKQACFEINADYCRLKQVSCDSEKIVETS